MQNTHYYMTNAKHIHLISFQMESVDKSGTLNIDQAGPEKLINNVGMSVAKDGVVILQSTSEETQ